MSMWHHSLRPCRAIMKLAMSRILSHNRPDTWKYNHKFLQCEKQKKMDYFVEHWRSALIIYLHDWLRVPIWWVQEAYVRSSPRTVFWNFAGVGLGVAVAASHTAFIAMCTQRHIRILWHKKMWKETMAGDTRGGRQEFMISLTDVGVTTQRLRNRAGFQAFTASI